jgi:hypothetical protein
MDQERFPLEGTEFPRSLRLLAELESFPELRQSDFENAIDTSHIMSVDRGLHDAECREKLKQYYSHKGKWKPLKEIFGVSMYSQPDLANDPDFTRQQEYYVIDSASNSGIDFTAGIRLARTEYVDKDFFNYFFSYRMLKRGLPGLYDFLDFNLQEQFDANFYEFKIYLEKIFIPLFRNILREERIDVINSYLDARAPDQETKNTEEPESFKSYLNLDGQRIYQKLVEVYSNPGPREKRNIAYMVQALIDLKMLPNKDFDLSKIHRSIAQDFGGPKAIGARETLRKGLLAIDVDFGEEKINRDAHLKKIKGFLTEAKRG